MNKAVIGLGFGDEGKGLVTDYLCFRYPVSIVARYSGGQQAGHTVCCNGNRHVFSNIGSGAFRGVPTYWGKTCTVDPIALSTELLKLESIGVEAEVFIHREAPVTTPYEAYANQHDKQNMSHGSCGVGVGKTFERESSGYHIVAEDLYQSDKILNIKLKMLENLYPVKVDLGVFKVSLQILRKRKVKLVDDDFLSKQNTIVFEGSQGLLLDQEIGFFPHVTRSHTGTKGILKNLDTELEYYFVTRAYQTRHGNGPMTNLEYNYPIKIDPNETNVTNDRQGMFYRSILDLDLIAYALHKNGEFYYSLVITCLDHLLEYKFTFNDQLIDCKNEREFLIKIMEILTPNKLLISRSPDAKNIEIFEP